MGLESANYFYAPPPTVDMEVILHELEAELLDPDRGAYCLRGEDYWIDLLVGSSLSIRVAFSNPIDAINRELQRAFSRLLRYSGTLYDPSIKEYFDMISIESWEKIWQSYLNRQMIFTDIHGPVILAASADDLFDFLDVKSGD